MCGGGGFTTWANEVECKTRAGECGSPACSTKKQLLEIAGAYKERERVREKCLLTINSDWLL